MYTLDDVIKEFLIEQGDSQLNKYSRAYQLGVAGLRQLNMDRSGTPKTVELDINDVYVAQLPNDFISLVRLGICGADGHIHAMTEDGSICFAHTTDDCGNLVPHNQQRNDLGFGVGFLGSPTYLANFYRNGELMGGFFGLGGGQNINGTYRIDLRKNQIQFGSLPQNSKSVVLEYISDISALDGDFAVHPFVIETVKAWIAWRWILNDRNRGLGEKQYAEQFYKNNLRDSVRRFNAETPQTWLSALRRPNTASVKF